MRLIASALAVVLLSSVAAISPASADLYDEVGAVADIRVQPVAPALDAHNQPARVLQPGAQDAAAASMQVFVQNQWVSGDRILVQLFDSAQNNCASVPTSIGYSAAPTIAVSPTPLTVTGNSPWRPNNGSPDTGGGADVPVSDLTTINVENTLRAPTFNVQMLSTPGCEANGIHDIVAIQLTNQSQNGYIDATLPAGTAAGELDDPANIVNTAAWVFTISGVTLDIGTSVAPGPVHAVPFGQNALPAPGTFENTVNIFGGNLAALQASPPTPVVANLWTNPAFIVPVTLEGELAGTLINDSSIQKIGKFTFAESQADGWDAGVYTICFTPGITNLQNNAVTPLQITTTPATLNVTATVVNDPITAAVGACLQLNITNPSDAAINSITVDNIYGRVVSAGTKSVNISAAPALVPFITPDDQDAPSDSAYSDVNMGAFPLFSTPLGQAQQLVNRIGGNNRYETAAKIALSGDSCANFAVLANGDTFADALSASYLAGALSQNDGGDWAPILTTPRDQLSPHAIQAIRELGVRTVYIVGGTAAINAAVQAHVESLPRAECGGTISDTTQKVATQRYSGPNRYLTNKAVVQAAQSFLLGTPAYNSRLRYQADLGQPSKRTAILVSGENFADAMSAGPYAYGDSVDGYPLILTTGGSLSSSAAESLVNLDIEQVIIVGGTGAVGAGVESAVSGMGLHVIRIGGGDRYTTNAMLNGWALTPTMGSPGVPSANPAYDFGLAWGYGGRQVFLARGDNFADALAVAPLVAWTEGFLVLSPQTALHPAGTAFLTAYRGAISAISPALLIGVTGVGLGAALSQSVINAANAIVNP